VTAPLLPDLALARRYVASQAVPGDVVLVGVTGSHHYGFPSPDSDLDLKGIHLAPTRALLGLGRPPETFDRLEVFDGVECDLTTHEAGKALGLLAGGNGNVLERIASPFQLREDARQSELRALALGSVGKHFHMHYRGYFAGMCREHERESPRRAKSLLYTFRVALTGIHLLRTGEVVADVLVTAAAHGFKEVAPLVSFKRDHAEKGALPDALGDPARARWADLASMLEDARARSPLADRTPNVDALDDWLVRARLAAMG
jgi:predicted nucleotidyltransferase